MLALIGVGAIRLAIPESLSFGPDWLLLAIVVLLLIPIAWTRYRRNLHLNRTLGIVLTGVVTLDMVYSLTLLVVAMPQHRESPRALL